MTTALKLPWRITADGRRADAMVAGWQVTSALNARGGSWRVAGATGKVDGCTDLAGMQRAAEAAVVRLAMRDPGLLALGVVALADGGA